MLWRTHLLFAAFFYFLTLRIFSLSFSLPLMAVIMTSSLLPDIDSSGSWINQRVKFGKAIAALSEHRGFWHSIFGMLATTLVLAALVYFLKLSLLYSVVAAAGYVLHLLADSLTVSGINWFWKSGKLRGFIRTGTLGENLFFAALCIALVLLLGIEIQNIAGFFSRS